MKKNIGLLLILFFALPVTSKNTCDGTDKLIKSGIVKLKNYTFLKEQKIYLKKAKKEGGHIYIPMSFNRGVKYKFYLMDSDQFEGKLMLDVYNNMKREFIFASNYHSTLKKRYPSVQFTSQSTINGCLDFYYEEGKEGCSVAVAGFLKK